VLARGYSLTRAESSPELLRSAGQVKPGDRIITVLQHGQITSRVESVEVGRNEPQRHEGTKKA